MHVHVDAAGRSDKPFRVADRCCRPANKVAIDAVHDRRVACLPDVDDTAVLYADIALHYPQDGIDHKSIAQQHVERAHRAVESWCEAQPVPQRLATPVETLLA